MKANMAKPTNRKKPARTSWRTTWFMIRPSFCWLYSYPLNHPQEQDQGVVGSCFFNQRPQHGQCLVQAWHCPPAAYLPLKELTRSCLQHSTVHLLVNLPPAINILLRTGEIYAAFVGDNLRGMIGRRVRNYWYTMLRLMIQSGVVRPEGIELPIPGSEVQLHAPKTETDQGWQRATILLWIQGIRTFGYEISDDGYILATVPKTVTRNDGGFANRAGASLGQPFQPSLMSALSFEIHTSRRRDEGAGRAFRPFRALRGLRAFLWLHLTPHNATRAQYESVFREASSFRPDGVSSSRIVRCETRPSVDHDQLWWKALHQGTAERRPSSQQRSRPGTSREPKKTSIRNSDSKQDLTDDALIDLMILTPAITKS